MQVRSTWSRGISTTPARSKIHFSEFKDYVKANLQLATRLEALIQDYVDYGEAKEKFERP